MATTTAAITTSTTATAVTTPTATAAVTTPTTTAAVTTPTTTAAVTMPYAKTTAGPYMNREEGSKYKLLSSTIGQTLRQMLPRIVEAAGFDLTT